MKRHTKLILISAVLLCLIGGSAVLVKTQQYANVPFPSAVVVLNDASWNGRYRLYEYDPTYLWEPPNTVVYNKQEKNGKRIVQRRISAKGVASPPDVLPILLKNNQYLISLSPNGKRLCLWEKGEETSDRYILLGSNGQDSSITLNLGANPLFWSQDSTLLYSIRGETAPYILERYSPQTGTVPKTILKISSLFFISALTPDGKLLGLNYNLTPQSHALSSQWQILEIQGEKFVITKHQKTFAVTPPIPSLSPDGKRLLWTVKEIKRTGLEKRQQKLGKKPTPPRVVIRYFITDIDGKNERMIGLVPKEMQKEGELEPKWTPDGKGVHFVQEGKLMYLAVP